MNKTRDLQDYFEEECTNNKLAYVALKWVQKQSTSALNNSGAEL